MGNFRGTRCLGGIGTTCWPEKMPTEKKAITRETIENVAHEFLQEAHNYYEGDILTGYERAIKDILTAIDDTDTEISWYETKAEDYPYNGDSSLTIEFKEE